MVDHVLQAINQNEYGRKYNNRLLRKFTIEKLTRKNFSEGKLDLQF